MRLPRGRLRPQGRKRILVAGHLLPEGHAPFLGLREAIAAICGPCCRVKGTSLMFSHLLRETCSLVLVGVKKSVREVLDLLGLSQVLLFAESVEEALEAYDF